MAGGAAAGVFLLASPAFATYVNEVNTCPPAGPSGSVCIRYQWDSSARLSNARASSSPTSGHYIYIYDAFLVAERHQPGEPTDTFVASENCCADVGGTVAGTKYSGAFAAPSVPSGTCDYYDGGMDYYTAAGNFTLVTDVQSSAKCS